jgi:methyl-accepting chemotaxis protein
MIYNNTATIKSENKIDVDIDVERIRSYYLAHLLNDSSIEAKFKLNLNVLFNKIKARENIDEVTSNKMDESFAKIRAILAKPINKYNYTDLSQEIDNLQSALRYVRNTTDSINYVLYLDSGNLADQLRKTNRKLMFVGILSITLLGLFVASSIYNPLKQMVKRVKSLETGDLSQKDTLLIGSREVSETAMGLDKAIIGLRGLVTNISRQSNTLDRTSAELSSISAETGTLALEVANSANELAIASSEQVRQITEALNSIQELSNKVIQVTRDSQKIANASGQVAESAQNGQHVTNNVAREIKALYDSTKEVAEATNMLIRTSEEITGITAIIEGISEQTALLALNASIEAARAGEHGKGFAVVAREVGKLAQRSKQSAQSISDLITEMGTRTNQSVQIMLQGIARAEESKNLAEQATVTFQEINQALMATITEIRSIATFTKQMTSDNDKATDAISAISAISEENLANTEEVSAITQEQSASMAKVTSLADNLREIANTLKRSVEQFEL